MGSSGLPGLSGGQSTATTFSFLSTSAFKTSLPKAACPIMAIFISISPIWSFGRYGPRWNITHQLTVPLGEHNMRAGNYRFNYLYDYFREEVNFGRS